MTSPMTSDEEEDSVEKNRLAMVVYSPPNVDSSLARHAPPTNLAAAADVLVTRQEFNELKATLVQILAILKDSKKN